MSDHSELKKLAEVTIAYDLKPKSEKPPYPQGWQETFVDGPLAAFQDAATPEAVLALIADIEALIAVGQFLGKSVDVLAPRCYQLKAEVEALHTQVATLQTDANSWQSGYDKGRAIGTKTALDERDQLRKDAARYRFVRGRGSSGDMELVVAMINQKTRQYVFLDGQYTDTQVDAAMRKGEQS